MFFPQGDHGGEAFIAGKVDLLHAYLSGIVFLFLQ